MPGLGLRLGLHDGQAGVIVRELVEMRPRDLRGRPRVVVSNVGLKILSSVLELDVHPYPNCSTSNSDVTQFDADPLAGHTGLLSRKVP